MHMVSRKDLNSAELETMRTSRSPTTVMTANGEVQTREEATDVKKLALFVKVVFLEKKTCISFFGRNSVRIMGIRTSGPAVKNHISSTRARELIAIKLCHSWLLVYQRVSSSTAFSLISSSLSSQDSVCDVNRNTEILVPERNGCTSEELRGNPLHESTETENKNKMKTTKEGQGESLKTTGESEEVQRDISHELLDWPQEFRENLVDESISTGLWGNPEQGSQGMDSQEHENRSSLGRKSLSP